MPLDATLRPGSQVTPLAVTTPDRLQSLAAGLHAYSLVRSTGIVRTGNGDSAGLPVLGIDPGALAEVDRWGRTTGSSRSPKSVAAALAPTRPPTELPSLPTGTRRVSLDVSGALVTITSLLATWGEPKTDAYLAALAKQDIAPLSVSNRQVVDQVILGEYWIGVGISAHHPVISATRGAPSATVLLDPVPSLSDVIQVLKGTKHPHSAMLFVDFVLSEQAQRMIQAAEYFPSNPNVEPAPSLRMVTPKNAGVPELMLTSDVLEHYTPKSLELYKRHFR